MKIKNFWIILIGGVLVRIFLSFSTFHPDLKLLSQAGSIVGSGNILNIYDFSSDSAILNYPPSIYLFHGLFYFLFGGLHQINQNMNFLLLKLPYFIFDILIALSLIKIFNSEKKSQLAFVLWIFNPVNLYATYMMGQFDIIPTSFTILAVYLTLKNKLNWAALSLGCGIAFKIFPLFLVIPLLILGKSFWDKIKLLVLAAFPYLVSILPYISSQTFRANALFANQNTKSLYAAIPVSGGESILLFPAPLIFFYLVLLGRKNNKNFWKVCFISLLLFFIFTHFHPQWFLWLTPFLILDLVENQFRNIVPIILMFISFIASLFFFDPSLTLGLFAPIFPTLSFLPSIWELININVDYNASRSLLQTVFVGACIYLIYECFPKKNNA